MGERDNALDVMASRVVPQSILRRKVGPCADVSPTKPATPGTPESGPTIPVDTVPACATPGTPESGETP
ncbi:MAG: hypothetical protein LBV06_07295 [Propionibacteriaceae bacterium]|nr:hypothetical protein [Propionibacteriaceae bacterium]